MRFDPPFPSREAKFCGGASETPSRDRRFLCGAFKPGFARRRFLTRWDHKIASREGSAGSVLIARSFA
jgi:hypothetical protein